MKPCLSLSAILFLCLVLSGSMARPVSAQLVDEEAVGRLTIGGGIGFVISALEDVDDNFDRVNQFLRRAELRTLSHVPAALATHLDVRYRLGQTPPEEPDEPVSFLDRLSIGFSWGALNARSEFDAAFASVRFYSRSTTYMPYIIYHFPMIEAIEPRVQMYAGGGPLFLRNAVVDWQLNDFTNNAFLVEGDISEMAGQAKASGNGTGYSGFVGASYQLNSRFSVGLDLGYRRARVTDISLDEVVGQESRFQPGTGGIDVVRRLEEWGVIDFFMRDPGAEYLGTRRTDPKDAGGCDDCPSPYFDGGKLEVDYSGPFSILTFRLHF